MGTWLAEGCRPSSERVVQKPLLVRWSARIPRRCPGNLDPCGNLHPGGSLLVPRWGESLMQWSSPDGEGRNFRRRIMRRPPASFGVRGLPVFLGGSCPWPGRRYLGWVKSRDERRWGIPNQLNGGQSPSHRSVGKRGREQHNKQAKRWTDTTALRFVRRSAWRRRIVLSPRRRRIECEWGARPRYPN